MLLKKRILFLIMISFFIILINNVLALASLSLTPTNQFILKNETLTINITVNNVIDLYGVQLSIKYDEKLLKYLKIEQADLLKEDGRTTFEFPPNNDIDGILKNYILSIIGNVNGVDSNGTVAIITFIANDTGIARVDIFNGQLINSNVEEINHLSNNATITITDGGPICGDEKKDPLEKCDRIDLDNKACVDFGYTEGDLSCCPDCTTFDLSLCRNITLTCIDNDINLPNPQYTYSNVTETSDIITGPSCIGASGGSKESIIFKDECKNNNKLSERICNTDGTAGVKDIICEEGCIDGKCKVTITCSDDNDCPSVVEDKICQESQACTNFSNFKCENPGTRESKCVFSNSSLECSECPSNCLKGECLECTINKVEWSKKNVIEGEEVHIELKGNCTNQEIEISIIESNIFSKDNIYDVFKANYSNNISYIAEYTADEYGLPEFYIKIKYGLNIIESDRKIGKMLKVRPSSRKLVEKKIKLNEGKNELTMSLITNNMSIEEIFKDIKNKTDKIYTYNNINRWKIYYFNKSLPSNLFELKEGEGYIVYMKEPATLKLIGSKTYLNLSSPEFKMYKGWNLMSIFYERYSIDILLGNNTNNKLYILNKTSYEFFEEKNRTKILSENGTYWVYVEEDRDFLSPLGDLPSLNIFWKMINFFRNKI